MRSSASQPNPYNFVALFGFVLALVGVATILFRLGGVGPTEISISGLDVHTVSAGVVFLVIGIGTMLVAAGQIVTRRSQTVSKNLKPVVLGRPQLQNDELHKAIEVPLRLNDEHVVRFDATSEPGGSLTIALNVDGHQQVKRDLSPDPRRGTQQVQESFPLDGAQWELTCTLGQDGRVSASLIINGYPIFGTDQAAPRPRGPSPARSSAAS